MAFNRDRNSRSGGGGGGFRSRPSFGGRPRFGDRDRGDRGPVEMHDAICDNCGKSCQVPFRPTSGKPIFCSSCFENKREGGDSRGGDRSYESRTSGRSEDRPMYDATCADCGNSCKVPFQPNSDKPVFCSNCFGEKKNTGGSTGGRDKFEQLNAKLDKILSILTPLAEAEEEVAEEVTEEVTAEVAKPVKKAKSKKTTKTPKEVKS